MLADDWVRQAVAQLELDSRAALVGGRVLDERDRVTIGSPVLGMGGIVGMALDGCPATEIGYFGLSLSPRNVAALQGGPWVARRSALADAGSWRSLTEVCLRLYTDGWRIVWTPHVTARQSSRHTPCVPARRDLTECARYDHLIQDDPYYNRFFSLDSARAYQLCLPEERARALENAFSDKEAMVAA